MALSESGALAARRSTTFLASASSSAAGTQRAIRPSAWSLVAGRGSPSSSISRVVTGPSTSISFLARNQLGARPTWASDMPKRALSLATTRSQCSASSLPPAMASPCTTATTGSGQSSMARSMISMPLASPAPADLLRSAMSRPAQNTEPLPRITTTRSSAATGARSTSIISRKKLAVERVALLRPVHPDGPDRTVLLDDDLVHDASPRCHSGSMPAALIDLVHHSVSVFT